MRMPNILNPKLAFLIVAMMAASLIAVGYSCAGTDDRSDRFSNGQSSVFSPGYINAAKQKTDAIINQINNQRSPADDLLGYAQNKLANNTAEDASNKIVPELRRKSSSSGKSIATVIETTTSSVTVTTPAPSTPETSSSSGSQSSSQTGYGEVAAPVIVPDPTPAPASTTSVITTTTTSYSTSVHQDPFYGPTTADAAVVELTSFKGKKEMTDVFKSLLSNKSFLSADKMGKSPDKAPKVIAANSLQKSALSLPIGEMSPVDANAALRLADVIKEPTEDQKMLIEIAESAMNAAKDSSSPELKKASDDLIETVAEVLTAQAVPDLLKEEDVSSIKGIFAELGNVKSRIIFEYQESTKPYYDKMLKELSNNISLLQLNRILSNTVTKNELAKLPPSELDKIMEKLRQAKNRSFEEDRILQQEIKYRKDYIDPSRRIMEERMRFMMEDFTRKLSKMLEDAKK